MKTYFYSGHIARAFGGAITHEFSGLYEAKSAKDAYQGAYDKQLTILEAQGGTERSHYIQMDAFNVVEE